MEDDILYEAFCISVYFYLASEIFSNPVREFSVFREFFLLFCMLSHTRECYSPSSPTQHRLCYLISKYYNKEKILIHGSRESSNNS